MGCGKRGERGGGCWLSQLLLSHGPPPPPGRSPAAAKGGLRWRYGWWCGVNPPPPPPAPVSPGRERQRGWGWGRGPRTNRLLESRFLELFGRPKTLKLKAYLPDVLLIHMCLSYTTSTFEPPPSCDYEIFSTCKLVISEIFQDDSRKQLKWIFLHYHQLTVDNHATRLMNCPVTSLLSRCMHAFDLCDP